MAELDLDEDKDFLLDGIINGFELIPADSALSPAEMDNYSSSTKPEARDKVEQTLQEEIAEGNYVITPNRPTIVSALSAVPKVGSQELRLIHDCSMPVGRGVNSYVPSLDKFHFQTIDDAVKLVDTEYYLAKIDLRHAYRSVPIHPSNYPATGLKWTFSGDNRPTYLYDTRLCFGGRRSPGIFHRLTQSVKRMMHRKGFQGVVVYLDDFLIVSPSQEECELAFTTLRELLLDLGFQISPSKVVPPCQQLTFLGIVFDTRAMELSLPQSKLDETSLLINTFLARKRASKRQLQQLAGKLNWACRVVHGGRTFLRRILDSLNSLRSASAKFRFTPEFRKDLFWWQSFLAVFNGKRLLHSKVPIADVETDASQDAVGSYFRGDWEYSFLPADAPLVAPLHINIKEAFAIYLAVRRWGPQWANHHVIIHCDNQAAVAMINKGTTANPIVMSWLRHLFWLSAIHNFRLTAVYVPGIDNIRADRISRMHNGVALLQLYSEFCRYTPSHHVSNELLVNHMSPNSALFLCSRFCTGLQGAH